jgi:nucleotidyltransferase substrate binding protein (TIGR01987 family)
MGSLSFAEIEKALSSLERALAQPENEYIRDAAIQRFEYTFELAWKLAKKALQIQGLVSQAPRTVIRDSAQQGWLSDAEAWMKFLDDRNLTSHTYNEKTAQQVYETSRAFAPACKLLIEALKKLP